MYAPVPGMQQPPAMYGMQQPPAMYGIQQPPAMYGMQQPPTMLEMHQPLLHGMQAPPNPMPGYEGTGGGFLPPPPIQPMPSPDQQPEHNWNIQALTEEEAKEAFCNYANSKCCYSSGPATDGVIGKMEQFNTYRYRLETYTESRKTEWATKPYDGQPVHALNQTVPNPWEIPVQVPAMFTDSTKDVEVPNTSSVKPCDTCSAEGRRQCTKCHGSKSIKCSMCSGSGKSAEEQSCISCNGSGKKRCNDCSGRGTIVCETCKGKKQLLMYIKLIVEWKNNVDDYLVEQSSGLEKKYLDLVSGKKLLKDTKLMVYPMSGFPEHNLAQASERLVREHHSKFSQKSRILQQQQSVELIPITKVMYHWKENDYVYFVFGIESKVKAIDYPATCCCTII